MFKKISRAPPLDGRADNRRGHWRLPSERLRRAPPLDGRAFFFFEQKTAYEMSIGDWSSDVCSSDLIAAAVWGAAKRANQIILHAGSRKDMRAQHVDAASPQRRRALLHHAIRFHLVNRVRQSVGTERKFLGYESWKVRTIRRHAARKNEFLDHCNIAVGFGDCFHHPRRSRNVDLPHSVDVQYSRTNWIDHECQMHNRNRTDLAHQQVELAAR